MSKVSMIPVSMLLAGFALVGCKSDEVAADTDAVTDTDTSADTDVTGDTDASSDTDTSTDTDAGDTDAGDTDASDTDSGDTDIDPLAIDDDGDGVTENDGDCDDLNDAIYPAAAEVSGNGIDENCNGLVATVDMSCHGVDSDLDGNQDAVTAVRIVGPWWSWDPVGGPVASDNGDGTWSVLFEDAPGADMEYLWSINETSPYEGLIDDMQAGGTCAPITDYSAYANRKWIVGSDDIVDTYASCTPCDG